MFKAFVFAYGFFLDVFRLIGAAVFLSAAGVLAWTMLFAVERSLPEPTLVQVISAIIVLLVLLIGIRGGIREVSRREFD